MYFSDLVHTLQNISADEKAVFVSGQPGSGKTFAALQFCAEHKESLYFSFKNLDTAFALRVFCNAHTEIFGACESWFDFFAELNSFLESDSNITVVLLGRPWETPPIPCRNVEISYFSMPQLADVCSLPDQTAAKLYCLTGAIPALLSLYDNEQSFEDNVRAFLRTDSTFYRLAANRMNESFRTPESYNTLLYAMANGYNRIGEIAKLSGFPKNKCDKYIKALIEHGLVIKAPGENGHTKYLPAKSYLTLWYKCLLTAVPNPNGSFGEDIFNWFMQTFNNELMTDFYKDMCYYWLEENINSISTEYIDTKN